MTKPTSPMPQPGILDISAYKPGKSGTGSTGKVYKLSANETPLGASPAAVAAYQALADDLHSYPDGASYELRQAIAERFGIHADHIVCGSGSDELLQLLAHAYLGPGDEALYSQYGFLVYPIVTQANGARGIAVPEKDFRFDVDAALARVSERTKLVFLANPNNPTGTYLPFDEVRRLHAGLPDNCLLVLDAAYAEYVQRNDYEAGIELVGTNNNVVMTRTFSKAYGLAGLRLGWAYCPAAITDVLNRIRGPFNVTAAAQAAGIAAMREWDHLERAVAHNAKWLPRLSEACTALGLKVTPSVGNFLLVHFPHENGNGAHAADDFLTARGLLCRRMDGYGIDNALRISIGTDEAMTALIVALGDFTGKGAAG